MRELCQKVLNGKSMPYDWKSAVVPIYKEKDVLNCSTDRGMKSVQHGM